MTDTSELHAKIAEAMKAMGCEPPDIAYGPPVEITVVCGECDSRYTATLQPRRLQIPGMGGVGTHPALQCWACGERRSLKVTSSDPYLVPQR